MRRALPIVIALGVLSSSCFFRSSPTDAREEITEIANSVQEATYAAVYRFAFMRQFPPGQSTKIEVVQEPPVFVRKVTTSTRPEEGKPVSVTAWFIRNEDGEFVCDEYEKVGVRCQKDPIASATFGTASIDMFFDLPREQRAFSSVRKEPRPVRIQGQQGMCFEAVPKASSPPPSSPQPTPERFRFELCYADDGILLRGRRTTLDENGAADRSESFVEVQSISRVVEPAELRLPGPVVSAADLPR